MLTGSSFLSYQNAPLQSIRDAIKDSEHHIVRVNEEGTGEIYDLDLSHTAPYAHPVPRRDAFSASAAKTGSNSRTDQTDTTNEKLAGSSGSTATPESSPQQTAVSSTGRKILQLPQIVSRRNAQNVSAQASEIRNGTQQLDTQEATVSDKDGEPRRPKDDNNQDRFGASTNGFAHPLRQPGRDELPPSPPLEPDMHSYMSTSVDDDGKANVNGVLQQSKEARTPASTRLKPVRSATDDVLALRAAGAGQTSVSREPSTASFASTSYQSATSHKADSDEEAVPAPSANGSSKFLNMPYTAEPAFELLHPASATEDPSAATRTPVKVNGRQPMPSRRNTTGAPIPRRRPGSVGSTGTRDSRRSSRERDLSPAHGDVFLDQIGASASQSNVAASPLRTGDAGFDDVIAKKYDEIRRERESKKIREQQSSVGKDGENVQSENVLRGGSALARARSGRRQTLDEPKALIGNVIGEGHSNYVLMYNMLTGIRIGVSRCQAKMKRPLTDADYSAKHKFTFDIIGNELTPSAKYDFKFKDYAPWVFRELREHFHLDAADYLLSLTAKYILSELGSPGKSGSFFYFSRDYRFIIKTIRHNEHKFLLRILKDYHLHIKENPHTLLSRFYGLHRVKLPGGKKIHFVIMNNLFPPHKDIHETYDLKGSAIGREYPEEKAAQKKGAVLKDLNWIKRGRELEFGPAKRAMLESQIRSDVALLQKLGIMDYSLLIGLHDMNRGNKEGLRQDALQVVQPDNAAKAQGGAAATGGPPGQLRREPTTRMEKEAYALRAAVRRSDAKALGSSSAAKLPERETSDRHHFIFYQDEGGFRSTDQNNTPTDWIYYFGIIDTLTLYNSIKRSEHYWKSITHNSKMISAIHPVAYGNRFCDFLFSLIKGADKSRRPRMQ